MKKYQKYLLAGLVVTLLGLGVVYLDRKLKEYSQPTIAVIYKSPAPTADSTPLPENVVIDESFDYDMKNWRIYQNYNKGVHTEVLPGNLELLDGKAWLGIQPDAEFTPFRYNNTFMLSKASFFPTETRKVIIQWVQQIGSKVRYIGSTGLWIHFSNIFDELGKMTQAGFRWAFGLNFLSRDSADDMEGLTFTFVEGWKVLCTIHVTGVDPTAVNTYRVEWTTEGWDAFVNGTYMGTCPVPMSEPAIVQGWADNSWVPHLILYMLRKNPEGAQGTYFESIQVWYEPIP